MFKTIPHGQTYPMIRFKFVIPSHSYLPNDSNFCHIEKKMHYHQHIYVPSLLSDIIKSCRTKNNALDVVSMQSSDFYSSKNITGVIEVEWLKIICLRPSEEKPYVMEYKYTQRDLMAYECVRFCKWLKGRAIPLHLMEQGSHINA
ncbi:hypothetical protein PR048_010707, partial [Dryococelus australis]